MKKHLTKYSIIFVLSMLTLVTAGCQNRSNKLIDESTKMFLSGDLKSADGLLQQAVKEDSQNINSYFRIATISIYNNIGNPAAISPSLKNIEIADSTYAGTLQSPFILLNSELYIEKVNVKRLSLANNKDVLNEIAMLESAIKNKPDDAKLYYVAAIWNYLMGNNKDAIASLGGAIKNNPEFTDAYILRGNIFLFTALLEEHNQPKEYLFRAAYDYSKVLEKDKTNKEVMVRLIRCYQRLNLQSEVANLFGEIYQADTSNTWALTQKVFYTYQSGKDYESSFKDFSILCKKFPDNLEYRLCFGRSKIGIGKVNDGIKDVKLVLNKTKASGQKRRAIDIIAKYSPDVKERSAYFAKAEASWDNDVPNKLKVSKSTKIDRRKLQWKQNYSKRDAR